MKHPLFYFSLLAVAACTQLAKAQQSECANQYWGNRTPYLFAPTTPYDPTPREYVPVFVNYVGRYGAAHLSQDIAKTTAYAVLQKADSAKALKEDGVKLFVMLKLLQSIEKPYLNTLTTTGNDELFGIGARMVGNFRNAFKRPCVNLSLVKDDKIVKSAEAIFGGIGRKIDAPECEKANYKDDDNLSPQLASKVLSDFLEKGDWKDNVESIRDSKKPKKFNENFLKRLFEPAFLENIDDAVQDKFISDLYTSSQVVASAQAEIAKAGHTLDDVNIRGFFTCDELSYFHKISAAEAFYKGGPGDDKTGVQIKASIPLLINFLNSTDAFSLSKTVGADVRITNPEVVSSFAALMNFKDISKANPNINKFDGNWTVETVLPTSANIQWILYQGTTADTRTTYLIKFLLNEVEVEIEGLKTSEGYYYYKWDDVKAYYAKKLSEEFEIEKLTDNMHTYLQNIK